MPHTTRFGKRARPTTNGRAGSTKWRHRPLDKMNIETISELAEFFETKLASLKLAIDVRNISTVYADDCENMVMTVLRDLSLLKNTFAELRNEIKTGWKHVKELQILTESAIDQNRRIKYVNDNLPKNIPKFEQKTKSAVRGTNVTAQDEVKLKPTGINENNSYIPNVEYLSKTEYDAIPKHVRGRLTYSMLNDAITDFNHGIKKKYQLLNKPAAKIGQFEIKLYHLYKKQETKDTKGNFFCTREDLRKFNSFKFDNTSKTILACLRHCHKIKDIYTCGTQCYAVAVA